MHLFLRVDEPGQLKPCISRKALDGTQRHGKGSVQVLPLAILEETNIPAVHSRWFAPVDISRAGNHVGRLTDIVVHRIPDPDFSQALPPAIEGNTVYGMAACRRQTARHHEMTNELALRWESR